jgi:hypothetical protein
VVRGNVVVVVVVLVVVVVVVVDVVVLVVVAGNVVDVAVDVVPSSAGCVVSGPETSISTLLFSGSVMRNVRTGRMKCVEPATAGWTVDSSPTEKTIGSPSFVSADQ